ncbi:MAG: VOC family protein [Pseudomonadota bacterium]
MLRLIPKVLSDQLGLLLATALAYHHVMLRGSINHVDLTVSDLAASEPFYDSVLGYLGFARQTPPPGTSTSRPTWQHTDPGQHLFSIALCKAKPDKVAHDRFNPGLHHLAFHAESRDDVDALHRFLISAGVTILDAPAEYPQYWPVYYAVFFSDPDGLKLEFVYMA